jgi:hypothetical protein
MAKGSDILDPLQYPNGTKRTTAGPPVVVRFALAWVLELLPAQTRQLLPHGLRKHVAWHSRRVEVDATAQVPSV